MVNLDNRVIRELLDLLDPRGSRVQSDLVAYLVKLDRKVLEDLLAQLERRVHKGHKEFQGQPAQEEKLVKKAIEASLELQELLVKLAQQVQEG
jgi:hypothetical protein